MPRAGYPSDKNGFQVMIHMQDFDGFKGEIPQCRIEGDAPAGADQSHDHPIRADATFNASKFQQRGKNLVFEPIPMEMLYTPAKAPQVLVKVNGLAAVCPAQNCDYNYVAATSGSITNVQLNGNKVTIDAHDLVKQDCEAETPLSDLVIEFADSKCVPNVNQNFESGTIECELDHTPAAGTHYGKVVGICGNFDFKAASPVNVPLEISSITPTTILSTLGNELVIIRGTGFPIHHAPVVAFKNGPALTVKSYSSTEIKCITHRFSDRRMRSLMTSDELIVSVNDVEQSVGVQTEDPDQIAVSIEP
jgi:hypothetical protein